MMIQDMMTFWTIMSQMNVDKTKVEPCKGLVKKSPSISCMGQNATFTSPVLMLSATKKYLMSKCHVCLLLKDFPFSANSMVHLLSW